MEKVTINSKIIYNKLKDLNVTKSQGPDKIHPRVWYELREETSSLIADIFRKSLEDGKLPHDWKCSEVVPLFKKGSKFEVKNYRPVSLTCIICKVMESIIKDGLLVHFERNNLFSCRQYGFLKKRSTTLQLLKFMDEVTEGVDKGDEFHVIYTDIEKAFDRVPHEKLLYKLDRYGVERRVIKWIEGFLMGRKFRVRVKESVSEWYDVGSGVPQGSILGPLLFNIYINDMIETEQKGSILLFADDAKIYKKITKVEDCEELQNCLNKVLEWFEKWDMKINADKCGIMKFNRSKITHLDYNINGKKIEEVKSARDLGVIFDNKLSFGEHIHNITSRAYKIMGLIKRNFDLMDRRAFICLYKALVRNQVEYASSVWSPYRIGINKEIEKVQRRATKIFKGCKNMSYEERLRNLGLPSLSDRRIRGT